MTIKLNSSPLLYPAFIVALQKPALLSLGVRNRKHRHLNKPLHGRRRTLPVTCSASFSFDGLVQSLISAFPSVNSIELLVPALGFASGAAIYLSSSNRWEQLFSKDSEVVGDWILFASPTPFNRSVLLRCPSLSFDDAENFVAAADDLSVGKDTHYVTGRIPLQKRNDLQLGNGVAYQRVCVGTADGGTISLDWPENLDLEREHGLDTTVVLVPGTPEGSMDADVMALVLVALRCGFFPIVMNPRGCAGSPVTTPRLFTAADSDDLCTAIQFIKRVRPLSTLMSVGLGYGANMLMKYLSEFGEKTPLTAASCVNNPFDIQEATKSFPCNVSLDNRLTSGLIHILRANKAIFQGKGKGFNMTRALSATSVRDFDESISMISHGYKSVEDFYSWCSTRQLVYAVKVPLLYIQSDSSTVPLFSIPRNSIEENPFTSLLMCSCLPANINCNERSSMNWCAHLVIEWLQAVELALLKGRHPLLNGVDIPLKPSSKGILSSSKNGEHFAGGSDRNQFVQNYQWEERRYKNPVSSGDGNTVFSDVRDASIHETEGTISINGIMQNTLSGAGSMESSMAEMGSGQVLETAEVILNMLDNTLPGSLDIEQKRKVLTAMEKGETLMKALETAVPEDVREKLSNSVTEIMQIHGRVLNLEKLTKTGGDSMRQLEKHADNTENSGLAVTGKTGEEWSKNIAQNLENSLRENALSKGRQENNSIGSNASFLAENNVEGPVSSLSVSEVEDELSKTGKTDTSIKDERERETDKETNVRALRQKKCMIEETEDVNDRLPSERVDLESSGSASAMSSDSPTSSDSEVQATRDVIHNVKTQHDQDKFEQNVESSMKSANVTPYSSPSSSINVSEALDAFISFDDSTQKAVNSVFGVIENVIDQLEKKTDRIGVERQIEENAPPRSFGDACNSGGIEQEGSKPETGDDVVESPGEEAELHQNIKFEQHNITKLNSSPKSIVGLHPGVNMSFFYPRVGNSGKLGMYNFPGHLNSTAFWESSYRDYLRRYFLSQMEKEKSSQVQPTADLFLDTEKGQWKMLDQVENSKYPAQDVTESLTSNGKDHSKHSILQEVDKEKIIDTSYVVMDNEQPLKQSCGEYLPYEDGKDKDFINVRKERLIWFVKSTILDSLEVEVRRKSGMSEMDKIGPVLASEMEAVAGSVALSLLYDNNLALSLKETNLTSEKFGTVHGKLIVDSISAAVLDAGHLKRVLPMGVIVGTSLASLGRYFNISGANDDNGDSATPSVPDQKNISDPRSHDNYSYDRHKKIDDFDEGNREMDGIDTHNNDIMDGAVAILGASTLLSHNENLNNERKNEVSSSTFSDGKIDASLQGTKVEEEDDQHSFVSNLTEKAISVASPVVSTKSGGEIDHERLLSIFAELGQKGGLLKFFGNIALLWGGIRGAMSLADRLISFLRVAERPLIYRVVGFACMVLVIWSPVAVPLLPHIVQSWTIKSSMGIAGYACLIGLHISVLLMIILWGKRIRGYKFPLDQYGLNLSSRSKAHEFLKGLVGGIFFVICIHSVSAWLGFACIGRPNISASSSGTAKLVKAYGNFVFLSLRGFITAIAISIVEELLFRSWLPDEIAVDLNYHQSILISALSFAVFQSHCRSLSSIPGFLFLSLALLGAKQRNEGSLFVPIGARVGIMYSSFVLQNNHLVFYRPGTPVWFRSLNPWHPFDGAVGLISSILLAICLYPWQDKNQESRDSELQPQET